MHPHHGAPVVGPFTGTDVAMEGLLVILLLVTVTVVLCIILVYVWPGFLRRCWDRIRGIRRRKPPPDNRPNPFENWTPGEDQDEELIPLTKVVRSPVRLLYSAAFERLTDGEIFEIHHKARGAVERLREASRALAECRTADAVNLCYAARGIISRGFGAGKHWLEAIVVADIAAIYHHGNDAESARDYFEQSSRIGSRWFERYPWLRNMCTPRRLLRFRK